MSLFGSREDDPLLQDDPFAPSEDDPSSQDARTPEEAPRDRNPSSDGTEAGSPDAPSAGGEASVTSQDEESSRFGGDDRFSFTGEEARRALVRGVDEAESGDLAVLNTAFDQGWRLEGVVYREDTADLLFLLHQQDPGTDQDGMIV
jgi:hypothetical protein